MAAALDAAHADGLVHRDVKPSNVLLTDGEEDDGPARRADFAYLADFGIAATPDDEQAPPLTTSGEAIGSAAYMAPERWSSRTYDRRSDVYSLACVFVELLTGRPPFVAPDAAGLMYAHLQEMPPSPARCARG